MASFSPTRSLALAAFVLPASLLACTADQFVDNDSGSGSDAAADGGGLDGQDDAPVSSDAVAGGDAIGVGIDAAPCVPDASPTTAIFSCGNGMACMAASQFCYGTKSACQAFPPACACNHTCECLKTALPNFCGASLPPACNDNNGELTLTCN